MTQQGAYVMKIILALLRDMGINLDKYLHEMTSFVLKIKEDNIISKKKYAIIAARQKAKKKNTPEYNVYFYTELMKTIISIVVIFIQSAKPSIRKAKTFPGVL